MSSSEATRASKLETAFCDSAAVARCLCVDLDYTLIATDSLWECAGMLLQRRPWALATVVSWLLRGRLHFERAVLAEELFDPKSLPYRRDLLAALRECHQIGRKVVLATTATQARAQRVAEHLGLFDEIRLGSTTRSVESMGMRDVLVSAYGEKGFDYVGGANADTSVIEAAKVGYLVGATSRTTASSSRLDHVTILSRRPSIVRALVKQLRPHQWAKNALLLLPVMLAPTVPSAQGIVRAMLAVIAFSLCASAGYVFNDLLDIEADRQHSSKFNRPFASGALPVVVGPPLFLILMGLSFGLSLLYLPQAFLIMLGLYFIGTLCYSLFLKRLLMLDVLVLAGLYTHRVLSGGIASGVKVSTWLLGFSMFLFTSLAFAKRYVELRALKGESQVKNRGYFRTDLEIVSSMGTASGCIAALVFMLYVDSAKVRVNYREPAILWLVLPILLYWLGRIWLLAGRGLMRDDPVKFALRDKVSLACAAAIALVAAAARYSPGWITAGLH